MNEADWQQALLRQIEAAMPPRAESETMPDPGVMAVSVEPPTPPWWPTPSGADGDWQRGDFAAVPADVFVEVAYRTLLGRPADPSGQAGYASWVECWWGRAALLAELARSEEGRGAGARVRGVWALGLAWRGLSRLGLSRRWRFWGSRLLSAWDAEARASGEGRTWVSLQPWLEKWAQALANSQVQAARAAEAARRAAEAALFEMQRAQEAVLAGQSAHEEAVLLSERLAAGLTRQEATLSGLAARVQALETAALPRSAPAPDMPEAGGSAPSGAASPAFERFYLAFEAACRGREWEIQAKLATYLTWLPCAGAVVADLGCGRGEWLSLLREHGHVPLGVDGNAEMVAHCRSNGLAVEHDDALAWLARQPAASLDAVTAFHVVEHVDFVDLLAWMEAILRCLRPGGVVIFETPNPENLLVGSHTFYHDPTHRNPLTPTLMQFLFEYFGLEGVTVLRLNPYPESARVAGNDALTERVNGHLYGPQDFAMVGRRRAQGGGR